MKYKFFYGKRFMLYEIYERNQNRRKTAYLKGTLVNILMGEPYFRPCSDPLKPLWFV